MTEKESTGSNVVLYQEIDGTKYEVPLPLTSSADIKRMMDELGLPSYIDLKYDPMQTAIVTIWACQKAPELHKLYPNAYDKPVNNKPISALLFGGAAVKILCEHSNGTGALSRTLKDTDFIVSKNQASSFCRLLLNLDKAFGTKYKYFRTKADTIFNAMRQGQRYRVRTINGVTKEDLPSVTVLDIFCDSIDLRHKIDVRESFEHCRENAYTIGIENLILSKCQFITDLLKTDVHLLEEHQQDFRILPYEWYASNKVVLGMEEKDVRDVCAILIDHRVGTVAGEISPHKMRKVLETDKKLALTVSLNLQNLANRSSRLEKWLAASEVSTVIERLQSILSSLPLVDKKWDKPWWNTAVETPIIG